MITMRNFFGLFSLCYDIFDKIDNNLVGNEIDEN